VHNLYTVLTHKLQQSRHLLNAAVVMQYERSAEALEYLNSQTDAEGRQLRVVKIPLPPPLFYTKVSEVKPSPSVAQTLSCCGVTAAQSHKKCIAHKCSPLCPCWKAPQPTTPDVLPCTDLAVHCPSLSRPCHGHVQEEASGVQQSGAAVPRSADERLAASYVNFLITNGAVIMPAFGLPEADARWCTWLGSLAHHGLAWCLCFTLKKPYGVHAYSAFCVRVRRAVAAVQSALPKHEVISIPMGREILLGGGNVHCITQQQPV